MASHYEWVQLDIVHRISIKNQTIPLSVFLQPPLLVYVKVRVALCVWKQLYIDLQRVREKVNTAEGLNTWLSIRDQIL